MKTSRGHLHIFAQHSEHDEARIVGDIDGLRALADAVDAAIEFGGATSSPIFTNDGEGYVIEVRRVTNTNDLPRPYTSYLLNEDADHWRERAFKAEAELSRMKHLPAQQ